MSVPAEVKKGQAMQLLLPLYYGCCSKSEGRSRVQTEEEEEEEDELLLLP